MSDRISDKVAAFDTLFTNNHIQKLKILLPYLDRPMQKNVAVYIKFLELKYTLNFFRKHPYAGPSPSPCESAGDFDSLCSQIRPYCTDSEWGKMDHMRSMFRMFENYREMSEMFRTVSELFPEGEDFGDTESGILNILSEMLKNPAANASPQDNGETQQN